MSQGFIDALMHFFSLLLLPLPGRKLKNIKPGLEEYITKAGITFPVEECLRIYNNYTGRYFFEFTNNAYSTAEELQQIQRHLILEAGNKAQENLLMQERLLALLSLLEFSLFFFESDKQIESNLHELSKSLNLKDKVFHEAFLFINEGLSENSMNSLVLNELKMEDELEGEWVEEHQPGINKEKEILIKQKIKGKMEFRYFESFYLLAFKYTGKYTLFINNKRVYPGYFYSFRRNDVLQFEGQEPVSYEEIEDFFSIAEKTQKIVLSGKNISYRYKQTNYSIKPFSFSEESGLLIGIIGNNGVGKSTILKLISNQLNPSGGKLFINGADLVENSYKLKSVTGFVPQEDIIFRELTVYENLLYHAQLCLGNLSQSEINKRINDTLERLKIQNIKNYSAGSGIDHRISDFQRICLKIAIELIRNPYILFLDEPLSGLSFSDTKRLVTILKEESYKGKLVILTSQLPSSEVFNMFDKVWLIDQDGYMIYNGEPGGSFEFFRNTSLLPYYFMQSRSESVSAEDVIKIVETKKIQSDGSISDERQVSPGAWYDAWRAQWKARFEDDDSTPKPLPITPSRLPGIEKQFLVYLIRNFRLRFASLRYILLAFLGIPMVGSLMAIITRSSTPGDYLLENNPFIPLSIFLSVNFMLLSGLLMGAEEIISEKTHRNRDLSLNLSLFSYNNSKVVYMLSVAFIQSFLYTYFTNLILEIHGLNLQYTVLYFSLNAFAAIFSLALSAGVRKLNTIYILIPFLIIPNLLFSGYLIPYDSSEEFNNHRENFPVVAEMIPSRWAYEALMVEQFSNNPYNIHFFNDDRKAYQARFTINHVLPVLQDRLNECNYYRFAENNPDSLENRLGLLQNEFRQFGSMEEVAPFQRINQLIAIEYDSTIFEEAFGYLTYLRFLMENNLTEAESNIRESLNNLAGEIEEESVSDFKALHHNKTVAFFVTGRNPEEDILIEGEHLYKWGENIYIRPENPYGRAHFFAAEKKINDNYNSTIRFNLSSIWIINLLAYILFLTNGFGWFLGLFRD